MPSRSTSSHRSQWGPTRPLLVAAGLILASVGGAQAFTIQPDPATDAATAAQPDAYDYYLAVSINGVPRDVIAKVHQEVDGGLSMAPDDLKTAGLLVPGPKALLPDGLVALSRIPNVTYSFDAEQQTIDFQAEDASRQRLIVDAGAPPPAVDDEDVPKKKTADSGVLLNYDVYASASRQDGMGTVIDPLSGSFDARAFGPFGLIDQTFTVLGADHMVQRLNTTWSYSDPDAMRTYRAGDIATGALNWTTPSRLGGIQIQNDFGLRSDIITYPVPSLSGSAALPSSVDVYVNNANRYSGNIPAGPFDLVDVPVVTGAGTVQVVVRDATGKEVVTSADYFASQDLLKPGLSDYSAEVGFARTNFGQAGDGYDRRLMGSASIRTGVSDWLTWEGHAEGGAELLNAGTGVTLALGRLGVGQFAVSGSRTAEASGVQVSGSLQLGFGPVAVGAHAQRTFGRFEDIASFTQPGIIDHSSDAPSALYQLSVSVPMPFGGGRASVSYTQSEPAMGDRARIFAASYGQRLFAGSASASAYKDFESGNYGVMASLWMPLGKDYSTGASVRRDPSGTTLTADVGHVGGDGLGDVDWQVRLNRNDQSDWSGTARTKLPIATVRAQAAHIGAQTGVAAEFAGAIVAAGGGMFLSQPVDDAFAVVDVGAAGVPVLYQNRIVGETGANGKALVPGLVGYQKNRISIDPSKLPLDKVVDNTAAVVSPARGAGTVVTFGDRTQGGTALVSFRDEKGAYLPLASSGHVTADSPEFIVGYDGAALLEGLAADNKVTINLPDGSSCVADVPFTAHGGDLVNISDVVCRLVQGTT